MSLNMEQELDSRIHSSSRLKKQHGRHSSDSAFDGHPMAKVADEVAENGKSNEQGIDLSQFCVCELESASARRKTSSVDEIFNLMGEQNGDGTGKTGEELDDNAGCASQRQRSLSDSQKEKSKVEKIVSSTTSVCDTTTGGATPPVPPRRARARAPRRHRTPPRPTANGLPPTPKVHMGACFSKVFNGCPLRINCTASWIHPDTRDQHVLIGAEEGIYTLNLNELHETAMDQLCPRRTVWLHVIKDVLMSLSGKTACLYRHDLLALQAAGGRARSLRVVPRIPERLVPRRFALSARVPDTRGCLRCTVARNPYNGYKYLCGATPTGLFLMQWYDPLHKFMLLKHFECVLPSPLRVFELVIVPELEYPLVCVGASNKPLRLDLLNMNSGASWFHSEQLEAVGGGAGTVRPRTERLHTLVAVRQLDKDAVLVCHENMVDIVSPLPTGALPGRTPHDAKRRQLVPRLQFDLNIDSIVCLADSVLAFHRHGVQGRSLRCGTVTQEITDASRTYRLLGGDKVVVLESHMLRSGTLSGDDGNDLYILAGHEASY